MIDTFHSFETPEGVELSMNIAGPVVRCYAYLIDISFRIGIQIILAIFLGIIGKIGMSILLILFFLLEWFYPVFFEVLRYGQTPGKKMLSLRVVKEDGTSVNWSSSIIRNLLRVVDFLPVAYLTGILSMVLGGRFQRLGDIASGTQVIYSNSKLEIPEIPEHTPRTFPIPLYPEEQHSIISLAERTASLSQDRVKELANILTDILNSDNEEASQELLKVANGLMGKS
ncbi:RDD family protein [bacterium]|nr:RDD family protein [bacterium]